MRLKLNLGFVQLLHNTANFDRFCCFLIMQINDGV
ncbi:hypothetical protein HD_1687 [[Haemophilus] ducreyi 35000HP]|uniref:Uncharacterized protein n=1 Tax=Haemophilus ducreyi (strain 35000HP / ATCC 700724) TaxID=233412 RepID=Q7VL06_HAEDU|nr:hypothetical protein HD_1687 [[Haemophilus] ducreyi 35000HP]